MIVPASRTHGQYPMTLRSFFFTLAFPLALLAAPPTQGADLLSIKHRLDAQLHDPRLALPAIELHIVDDALPWPIDRESFAFEKTDLDGSAAIYATDSWARASTDDEAAFVLAHEMAHAICGHTFKSYGLYAERSQAVGLSLALLSEASGSDFGFQFSNQAADQAMEDEADRVGADIARHAGFDPLLGARQAIGTSPANMGHASGSERIDAIRQFLAASPGSPLQQARPSLLLPSLLSCQSREPTSY